MKNTDIVLFLDDIIQKINISNIMYGEKKINQKIKNKF